MDPVTVLTGALLPIFPDFEGDRDLVPVLFARLGRGQPVPVGELAEAVAWPEARVRDCLASWWGIRFDESGRIGGFWGLDTAPTQHRLELEGRTLYAWCAWDTLFLPDLLGEPALVESRCPLANRPVRLEVAPEGVAWAKPGDCRLGLVPPEPRAVQAGVQEAFCCGVRFLSDSETAGRWQMKHPDGYVLTPDQGHRLGQ
ncbi:MAG: organomercurial lyase, partial [Thiohalospira sp.]